VPSGRWSPQEDKCSRGDLTYQEEACLWEWLGDVPGGKLCLV